MLEKVLEAQISALQETKRKQDRQIKEHKRNEQYMKKKEKEEEEAIEEVNRAKAKEVAKTLSKVIAKKHGNKRKVTMTSLFLDLYMKTSSVTLSLSF